MTNHFRIRFSKQAAKYYRQLRIKRKKQVDHLINDLQTDPYRLPNVVPIAGSTFEDYRARFGNFRLLY